VRDFVGGELNAEAFADGLGEISRRLVAVGYDHDGVNLIADIAIGYREHGGFDDRGVLLQGVFDFGRGYENTAALEAVVAPASYVEIAFAILIGEIAGKIPAVSNNRLGSLRVFVITEKESRIRGRIATGRARRWAPVLNRHRESPHRPPEVVCRPIPA
jgi:hypothetical protein